MNFLELCVKTRQRSDIPGTGPTAVTGQVGILEKIVNWVTDAWKEIELSEDWWIFRMSTDTKTLVTGTSEYAANWLPADFSHFWPESIYLKLSGENKGPLSILTWNEYTEMYLHETLLSKQPTYICISPAGKVYFNTSPDEDYTLHFDYQRTAQTLAVNSDVPALPVDFHDVIWLRALELYGEHYGAPEVYQPTSLTLNNKLDRMSAKFLPKITFRDNVYESSNISYS